jgi:hypothetical protein
MGVVILLLTYMKPFGQGLGLRTCSFEAQGVPGPSILLSGFPYRDGSFRNELFQVNDSLQGVVNNQLTEEEGIIHLGTICRTVHLLAS